MILTLLTKAVAVQVRILIIYVGESSLQRLLSKLSLHRSWKRGLVLVLVLQVSFHELLKKPLVREWSRGLSGGGNLSLGGRQRGSGSIAAFGGGSWWTYELIFTTWKRVTAGTAMSAWPGHSLV